MIKGESQGNAVNGGPERRVLASHSPVIRQLNRPDLDLFMLDALALQNISKERVYRW